MADVATTAPGTRAASGAQASSGGAAGGRTQVHSRTRRWVRHDRPVLPFVWRGLLPLLGLLGLGLYAAMPFARTDIEDTVRTQVRSQLDQAGFGWAQLAVSGQHLQLSGPAPDAAAADAALAHARQASCPSAWGRLTCAVQVTGQFDTGSPAPAALPAPEPAPASAAVAACDAGFKTVLSRSSLQFATGRAELLPAAGPVLDALARAASTCTLPFRIEGHTDAQGQAEANEALSQARAEAVRQALVQRGLDAARIGTDGFGEARPVADNGTEAGRSRNRRIEFKVGTGQ